MMKGPNTYARMKLERTRARTKELWMCKSSAILPSAGATIEVEMGEIRVNAETSIVARIFLP